MLYIFEPTLAMLASGLGPRSRPCVGPWSTKHGFAALPQDSDKSEERYQQDSTGFVNHHLPGNVTCRTSNCAGTKRSARPFLRSGIIGRARVTVYMCKLCVCVSARYLGGVRIACRRSALTAENRNETVLGGVANQFLLGCGRHIKMLSPGSSLPSKSFAVLKTSQTWYASCKL